MSEALRVRLAQAALLGVLALGPEPRLGSVQSPPAIVLTVGDPMPWLDPWARRRAGTMRLAIP